MRIGRQGMALAALVAASLGGTAGAGEVPLHEFAGPAVGSRFGHAVAAAGDVDADGIGDVIVGAAWDDIATGTAWIYSGADASVLAELRAPDAGPVRFGASVAGLGDVDGDGHADVIVGAPMADAGERVDAGAAWIFSGRDGSLLAEARGVAAGDRLGAAVAAAGDNDGDGVPDALVGAPRGNHALVVSGRDGAVLRRLDGARPGDNFGVAVAIGGDSDDDGVLDLIVGADQGGAGTGYARMVSGATGATLHAWDGAVLGGNFGGSVAGLGDVDRDGIADVAVGCATHEDWRASDPLGPTHVFSGATGESLFRLPQRGAFVSAAGDLDGDGHADLVLGQPFLDGAGGGAGPPDAAGPSSATSAGRVLVVSGRDGSVLAEVPGAAPGERFGVAVDGSLDLDGDGRHELIVGSDEFLQAVPARGRVLVLDLADHPLTGRRGGTAPGGVASDRAR